MDDKLQRAIRESERAGRRLAPRPPDELLQALKGAAATGMLLELAALRDWLSQFCEDVQPADDEARRLEEITKTLDSLRRLQPPFIIQQPPWPPRDPIYPGPTFRSPYSGAVPLSLPGQQYTGAPLVGMPTVLQPEITYPQPEITYHPPQTILNVNTPGFATGTSTSGSASFAA